jgi:hypothetical protein
VTISLVWAAAAAIPVLRGLAQAHAPKARLAPARVRPRRPE